MALTRTFRQTVQQRLRRDPEFGRALLREAVQAMIAGDLESGKALARDYINATVGFERLGQLVRTPPKSLMRMFSAAGNPQAKNLFAVLDVLQDDAGITLRVIASGRRNERAAAAGA